MKGFTKDNSKGFSSKSSNWGTGRSHTAQPTRMSRTPAKSKTGGSGNARPPATHAKYGVDPDVGPNRASRTAKKGKSGSGDSRPPNNRKGYGVDGVTLKPNPGYGV